MKTKNKTAILAVIIAVIAIIGSGTLAYFTAEDRATNVITSGNIKLELHEQTATGENFPKEGIEIMPGDIVSKIVTAENTGKHPLWLRVKLTKGVNDEALTAEDCISMDINDTEWTYKDGYYYYNVALTPGEETLPLFTEVYVDGKNVDNAYIGKKFNLNVTAYAVQSENNGTDIWSVFGWPED